MREKEKRVLIKNILAIGSAKRRNQKRGYTYCKGCALNYFKAYECHGEIKYFLKEDLFFPVKRVNLLFETHTALSLRYLAVKKSNNLLFETHTYEQLSQVCNSCWLSS